MIQFRANFFSETLGVSTSATFLLPQTTAGQVGVEAATPDDTPVLYLLHGFSDNDTSWTRNSALERYASDYGVAVVMPDAGTSFYCNEPHGRPYWDFITEELPALVNSTFTVATARENTFVAGLSMGGYGAFKWALNHPDRFAAAGSFSGALDMRMPLVGDPDADAALSQMIWDGRPIDATSDDLVHLVETANPATLPRLWLTCGTDDPLIAQNRSFADAAEHAGADLTVDWRPGEHEWGFWDHAIQQFLAFALAKPGRS